MLTATMGAAVTSLPFNLLEQFCDCSGVKKKKSGGGLKLPRFSYWNNTRELHMNFNGLRILRWYSWKKIIFNFIL